MTQMERAHKIITGNRATIASFATGTFGAAIAGSLGWPLWQEQELSGELATFVVALISGFLSCFLVSKRYLKFMEDKNWRRGILFGPLFGALAGAISGATTGLAMGRGGAFFGILVGGSIGLGVGFISWLMLGAVVVILSMKEW